MKIKYCRISTLYLGMLVFLYSFLGAASLRCVYTWVSEVTFDRNRPRPTATMMGIGIDKWRDTLLICILIFFYSFLKAIRKKDVDTLSFCRESGITFNNINEMKVKASKKQNELDDEAYNKHIKHIGLFNDPLGNPMKFPVIAADGHTYDFVQLLNNPNRLKGLANTYFIENRAAVSLMDQLMAQKVEWDKYSPGPSSSYFIFEVLNETFKWLQKGMDNYCSNYWICILAVVCAVGEILTSTTNIETFLSALATSIRMVGLSLIVPKPVPPLLLGLHFTIYNRYIIAQEKEETSSLYSDYEYEQAPLLGQNRYPKVLNCPLSLSVPRTACVIFDGNTYDRAHITRWIRQSLLPVSPMTKERFPTVGSDATPSLFYIRKNYWHAKAVEIEIEKEKVP